MSTVSPDPAFPPTQRIGIFVFEDFEPIDVFGFAVGIHHLSLSWQELRGPAALSLRNDAHRASPREGEEHQRPRGHAGLGHEAGARRSPGSPDDPWGGGTWPLLNEKADPEGVAMLLDWVRQMDGKVKFMTSVCTGAAVLARAGLLNGLPAATNHGAFTWVANQGPKVLWDSASRWVDAGRYVTSAGVSAGTDLGFYLVSRLAGRAVAKNAVAAAEYDWHRDPQTPISTRHRLNLDDNIVDKKTTGGADAN